VRGLLVITGAFGILGSGVLYYWHKQHAVKIRSLNLHGLGYPDGPDGPGHPVSKEKR
jgi:hypothetical protein